MKTLLKLMDVKTLVAGAIPVIYGSVYSDYRFGLLNGWDLMIILIGIILLQSSTNMINDLYDYKRGADSVKNDEKALASGEASLTFVKCFIVFFMLIDVSIAIYYSITSHWSIIVIAFLAVIIMYSYSAGKKPISYTPFGEITAGMTMGFGIMSTVIFIQSKQISFEMIWIALPTSLYIGTILLTNNLSDANEDMQIGRKTLPILLGIEKSERLWLGLCYSIVILTIINTIIGYVPIISLILVVLFFPYKHLYSFKSIKKDQSQKGRLMGMISQVGIRYHLPLIIGYIIAIIVK